VCYFSVVTGSKRTSDDGQDVQVDDDGHQAKRPRQDPDAKELKILLPSRVGHCCSL